MNPPGIIGVYGQSDNDGVFGQGGSNGVHGESASQNASGVWGHNSAPQQILILGHMGGSGVAGTSDNNIGVYGKGALQGGYFDGAVGVYGNSVFNGGAGVHGENTQGDGVSGYSASGIGVHGVSNTGSGETPVLNNLTGMVAGVTGFNYGSGVGVSGSSASGDAIFGQGGKNGVHGESASQSDSGVWGHNSAAQGASVGYGVSGTSDNNDGVFGQGGKNGVHGESNSSNDSGVWGHNSAGKGAKKGYGVSGTSDNNIGVYGSGGTFAGYFDGNIQANGNISVTGDVILVNSTSGDCAEDFDVEDSEDTVTPGTVLVIGNEGKLAVSKEEYDSRIAGVVSGAGNLRPAILLNRINSKQHRMPIALIGKAFCKVDATLAPIKPGDLLTTASTPGHAMKATDHTRAIGAILGKALDGLENGQGLIPILVSPR
jgi:hypothetical protein